MSPLIKTAIMAVLVGCGGSPFGTAPAPDGGGDALSAADVGAQGSQDDAGQDVRAGDTALVTRDGGVDAGGPDAGPPASCRTGGPGLTDCGPSRESCCVSLPVPGGTFDRTYSTSDAGAPTAGATQPHRQRRRGPLGRRAGRAPFAAASSIADSTVYAHARQAGIRREFFVGGMRGGLDSCQKGNNAT
jgi:hypothetical protein